MKREQKFHLRDWIHWEFQENPHLYIRSLCGISYLASALPKQIENPNQEVDALAKFIAEDKEHIIPVKVCITCYNSYTFLSAQLKRQKKLNKLKIERFVETRRIENETR